MINRKDKAIAGALSTLMQYFDTVQIFATKHKDSDDSTSSYHMGAGNIFARLSQIRLWLEEQENMIINAGSMPPPTSQETGGEDDDA